MPSLAQTLLNPAQQNISSFDEMDAKEMNMQSPLHNAIAGLSMTLLLCAGCGIQEEFNANDLDIASEQHALSTSVEASLCSKSFKVTTTKASNLWVVMINAGAKSRSAPDAAFLELDAMDCSAPKGTIAIPSCDMLQNGVAISTTGTKAKAVIDAVVDTGVKGLPTTTVTSYSIMSLRCVHSLFIGHPGTTCTFVAKNQ